MEFSAAIAFSDPSGGTEHVEKAVDVIIAQDGFIQ